MSWGKVKEVLGESAPIIGGLVGGPLGAGVGTIISSILGVENNPNAVLAELTANPEAVLKLKQYELDHKIKLEEIHIKELDLKLRDVASARSRQVESEKATGKRDYNLYALAWTIVIGFFLIVYFLMDGTVPEDKTGVLYLLLGTLATAFMQVVHYIFGSSSGSKQKDNHIAKMKER